MTIKRGTVAALILGAAVMLGITATLPQTGLARSVIEISAPPARVVIEDIAETAVSPLPPGIKVYPMAAKLAEAPEEEEAPLMLASALTSVSLPDLVLKAGELKQATDPPSADFDAESLIEDTRGLMPRNDWLPLFAFSMTYATGADNVAPRILHRLRFSLEEDGRPNPPVWKLGPPLAEHNFLEFGLFRDNGPNGNPNQVLTFTGANADSTVPILTWDSHGFPYERQVDLAFANHVTPDGLGYNINDLTYDLNFIFDQTSPLFDPASIPPGGRTDPSPDVPLAVDGSVVANPKYPRFDPFGGGQDWLFSAVTPRNGYIVAVRTSPTWETGQTLSFNLHEAEMLPFNAGPPLDPADPSFHQGFEILPFPLNTQGDPLDSYTPDFFESPDELDPDEAYAADFGVFEVHGDDAFLGTAQDVSLNIWNYQSHFYTPRARYSRPRWDLGDTIRQTLNGEVLDLRRVLPVEKWVALIGITAHGNDLFSSSTGQPEEINVILTDIGGDPFAPPGNGGFDPRTGLNTIFRDRDPGASSNLAVSDDYSFGGLWLFHDSNNDGFYQQPAPQGTGVTFTDLPMEPEFDFFGEGVSPGFVEWEYIPFPPGGGDPWWKIKLRYFDGNRIIDNDGQAGAFENTPDDFPNPSGLPRPDYFIVVRADSGFEDISGFAGDGTGLQMGADFRAIIEPRRWQLGREGSVGSLGGTFSQAAAKLGWPKVAGRLV